MKLYAVMLGFDYEGESLAGIYSTLELAVNAVEENFTKTMFPQGLWRMWWADTCRIERVNIDEVNHDKVTVWDITDSKVNFNYASRAPE